MPELQYYTLFEESMHALMDEHQLVAIPERPVLGQPQLRRYERLVLEVGEALEQYLYCSKARSGGVVRAPRLARTM